MYLDMLCVCDGCGVETATRATVQTNSRVTGAKIIATFPTGWGGVTQDTSPEHPMMTYCAGCIRDMKPATGKRGGRR